MFRERKESMLFRRKKALGLLLAIVILITFPVNTLASDNDRMGNSEPKSEDISLNVEESGEDIKSGDDSEPGSSDSEKGDLSLSESVITLSEYSYVCDGEAKEPVVTVKYADKVLELDRDYTVEYKNNTKIGTASVRVNGIGEYTDDKSEYFSIIPGKTTLTSTSSYEAVKLEWEKVTGASGYEIYRSTSKDAGYKLLKKIESESTVKYSDKDTSFNKTYYYKIRAYGVADEEVVYGDWSAVRTQRKILSAPVYSSASSSSTAVKIKWKKVQGASGYVVYRSTSEKGTYKKIATIKKASTVSYRDEMLSSSKTYYYKVRAYRTVNKKNCYGYVSTAKKITTKKFQGGWKYVNGYKLYYDKNGKLVKDVSSIIGKQSSYVIKVNKKKNCVTVYAKDGKNGYIIPVKAFPCSAGNATPITTAWTPAKYRWHALNGNCYGQWCTRIKQGFLFHSVMYGQAKNTTLSVSNYNKLGTTASHGCIRLRAGDAKWIYDNCKLKTKVIIYNSSNPGPLGKPSAVKLPKWHKWDPTDPTASYKCKQKGCH